MAAEGVQGSDTGSEVIQVTHMLRADDLTLLAYALGALQTIFTKLAICAHSKHLIINTAKSQVSHFKSKRVTKVPVIKEAGDALKCSDSFRYLGVTFHQTH